MGELVNLKTQFQARGERPTVERLWSSSVVPIGSDTYHGSKSTASEELIVEAEEQHRIEAAVCIIEEYRANVAAVDQLLDSGVIDSRQAQTLRISIQAQQEQEMRRRNVGNNEYAAALNRINNQAT